MNDEIKEILDNLKDEVWSKTGADSYDKLLDYITNLQHTEDLYNQLLKDYDEEVEENIKLTKLWKNEVEKRRKAVEYIKNHLEDKKYLNEIYSDEKVLNIVVDILNGENDE